MAEIPLVYPNHVYQPRRYVVDGLNRRLSREDAPTNGRSTGGDAGASRSVEDAVPGAASVSELELRGTVCLLATCARLDDPEVLSISLSPSSTTVDWSSPRIVELDFRQLELQPLVSVAAFTQDATLIRLILVDSQGTFVTLFFTDQLIPLDTPARVSRCTDYISDLAVLQGVTGSLLQSTMIAFANPTTAIIGLSPFLMTVDLEKNAGYLWSETQCLEDMKARSSSFGSLLTNFSDILLGRLNEGVMDMSPTAALCITSTSNPLLDSTYCITLHSDTSLRKWKIDMSISALPIEVHTLDTTKLPLSSKWSDSHNSVSLCSRTYDQTYAVCVHIKTDGFLADQVSPSVEALAKQESDCHLWVLYGDNQGTRDDCMALKVPKEALSLVGMSFSPASSRCSLAVLFEATDREHNRISTMHVTYPPSIMSIVSSEPKIEGQGSLDKVASQERSRIRSLVFGPSLMGTMEDSTVEEILHELDSCYLKFLFRPMFPRGNGTVLPPPSECIRRALAKLVHGYSKTMTTGMSIELELIRTIYEWRRRDHRQMIVAMTPVRQSTSSARAFESPAIIPDPATPATPYSVYDAFVQDDETDEEEMKFNDDEKMDEEEWQKIDQERSAEVEAHEKRWRRFLLQVWEEEQGHRTPLHVKWLASQSLQVLVRSGLTAIIDLNPQIPAGNSAAFWDSLDRYALNLLDRIEKDDLCSSRLYKVEQHLATIIGKAQLALEPLGENFVQDLTAIARSASFEGDELTDGDHDRLQETLNQLNPLQLLHWVQSVPGNMAGILPGLAVLGGEPSDISGRTWSQKQVANHQVRHSACALALRCVDSVRRLQLSRSLLLLDAVEGSQARDAALRAYLHAIAVLWTSSQRVPMPPTAFQARKPLRLGESSPDTTSPPNKRLSFGDDATSILSPLTSTMTTSIDVMIIEISQTMADTCNIPLSPIGMHVFLTRSYIRLAFSARGDVEIGKPSLLPELGALPRPKDDSIATDYPRLALRLLVPYVAYPLASDSADVVLSRKESLAQCLLIESHTAAAGPTQMRMREIACELLVPENKSYDNVVEQRMIRTAFEVLEAIRHNSRNAQISKEKLAATLKSMLPSGTTIEITRLCELETVTKMFSSVDEESWIALDQVAQASVRLLAAALLRLSRVMNRLSILERHLSLKESKTESQNPDVLLSAISNAISELTKAFPEEVCQAMPEYGKLWTRLFHHSVLSAQWKTAYTACVRNPNLEHRESSFRRLVRSMVDQGALGELLVLCTELGQRRKFSQSSTQADTREVVDLYEMASEILVQAVSRDIYSIRAASSDPASFSDYQGSLYALHVSQKHWRRAAQSMDLRYVNAQKALGSHGKGFDYNLQLVELRDCLIVEDLALAAVGSLNAIELVKDHAHRFLVSGEYGSYHKIPLGAEVDGTLPKAMESSKRARNHSGGSAEENSNDEEDRLANFMTTVELAGRAVRTLSLRSLFFDRSTDTSLAKCAFLRQIDSSKVDIESLFRFGYFQYGLLLARAWTNNRQAETASTRPGGSDLFFDCLCHLIETYLIPITSTISKDTQRPTFEQLHFALDCVDTMENFSSYVVPGRHGSFKDLHVVAMKMSAMSLIHKLTLTYTSATSPVAFEVASSWLESGSQSLPAWLDSFLLGSGIISPTGLFAPRPRAGETSYLGDPIALMNLYTKHGMLAEACAVVSTTLGSLDNTENTRESKAASRLPEKGDIDYFPYKSVDLLWNLIEIVLSKHALGANEEKKVRTARDVMKESITTYFSLLTLSESGMRSARALRK